MNSLFKPLIPIILMLSMLACDVNLGPPIPPPIRDMAVAVDMGPEIVCNDKSLIIQTDGTYIDSSNGGCRCIPDIMQNQHQCRYCLPLPDVIKFAKMTIDRDPIEYIMYSDSGCLEPIVIALYNDKFCGFTTEPPGSRRFYLFSQIKMTPVPFYIKTGGTCVLSGSTENSLKDLREVPITIFSEVK